MRNPFRLFFLFFLLAIGVRAAEPRQELPLDEGWKFALDTQEIGFEKPEFNDAGWRSVTLPHDWSIEAGYSKENNAANSWLPGGIGIYRRTFELPAEWRGKQIRVLFDAVYMNSTVWLNGQKVGGRPYGFISFACDLTPYLKKGKNTLVVLADDTPVPTARFYHGGGIYGHVKLQALPKTLRIVPDGGIFATTRSLSAEQAELNIATEIDMVGAAQESWPMQTLRHRLFDANNRLVAESAPQSIGIIPGALLTTATLAVPKPQPWSPESPYLYRLETTLSRRDGTEEVDRISTPIGLRTLKFSPETGFWLNGVNRKLQGVCEHYVASPVGRAIPDGLLEWRLKLLKQMGCNAIRTAHYPYPPTFYALCDKLGIMVMDEAFDGWHQKGANDYGGRFFSEWWQRDVTDFIRRDRNHPCVIMWSVGNETGNTDQVGVTRVIKELDPTRPTTGGTVFFSVDVAGFNAPGETPGVLEKFRHEHPEKPVVLTEVPHTLQTRGFYRVLTWWRDKGAPRFDIEPYGNEEIFTDGHPLYSSSYDNCGVRCSARQAWKRTSSLPFVCGEFRWTGFDCLGEAAFMGAIWPKRIYNCGIIDLAGIPKDHYYFYQSRWTNKPMIHLLPHWTHPGLKPGTIVPVVAYSNCNEAELFLNGKSLGRKKISDLAEFVWKVPYEPGELKAIAYGKDGKPAAEKSFKTAGDPARLKLDLEQSGDIAILTASVFDKDGNFVPWAQNTIGFVVSDGPAKHLGCENGDPIDSTHSKLPQRRLFYGLARSFYQTEAQSSNIIWAAGILGAKRFEQETTVAIPFAPMVLGNERLKLLRPVVHYTLDGTEPTTASPPYGAPFVIRDTTTVKAVVLLNDNPILSLSETFEKGPPLRVEPDDRFLKPAKQTGPDAKGPFTGFPGPFDAEIVGTWQEGKTRFVFAKDGQCFRLDGDQQTQIGWWWYDFPNDPAEDPNFTGSGEFRWKNSGTISTLKMNSQKATGLTLSANGKKRQMRLLQK
jgi:beta-galactosidase